MMPRKTKGVLQPSLCEICRVGTTAPCCARLTGFQAQIQSAWKDVDTRRRRREWSHRRPPVFRSNVIVDYIIPGLTHAIPSFSKARGSIRFQDWRRGVPVLSAVCCGRSKGMRGRTRQEQNQLASHSAEMNWRIGELASWRVGELAIPGARATRANMPPENWRRAAALPGPHAGTRSQAGTLTTLMRWI